MNFSDRKTKMARKRWISLEYGRHITDLANAAGDVEYCDGI